MDKENFSKFFPAQECKEVFSELNVWVSVDNCIDAARWIEGRPRPNSSLTNQLIVPYLDDQTYETTIIKCIEWQISTFKVPSIKIQAAAIVDPSVAPETWKSLSNMRFTPDISQGPPGAISRIAPSLADHQDKRFFVIQTAPETIELAQNPLRCLFDLVNRVWPTASSMRNLREKSMRDSGSAPTIFHQPYTDGPLPALIEALAFFVNGLDIGPNPNPETQGINNGYRSIQVIDQPPVDDRLFKVAHESLIEMFHSIS